ncbi:MAG: InlB B-repeat-containing protein [Elusimicrobiota bacterium]|nr:InlB B-repeat-containing protein [Endomicrobiia bacterium]MDW8165589.1 InlB B-repeat-containing protein [Elusimicrobiota bacterium]
MKKSISFILSISLVLFSLNGCAKKSKSPTSGGTTNYTLVVVVNPQGAGSVVLNPSGGSYNAGTVVTLVATANPGYVFRDWSGDLTGTSNPATIVMDKNKTVVANFTQQTGTTTYTLTVNVSPPGGGTVSPSSGTYPLGTQITLTATANPGYIFSGWSGDLSGNQNPAIITMDSNKNITASFTQQTSSPTYTLTVNISPAGAGTVNLNPSGGVYVAGSQVTLTAQANPGYVFSSWGGDATGTSSSITIIMNSNKTVTANFTQTGGGGTTYTLLVSIEPSGAGTVSLNPAGGIYAAGTSVLIQANPNPGWKFDGWSGNLSGSQNPTTIIMNSNKVVTANFSQQQQTYTLTVDISPTGAGTVTLNPAGGTYVAGTQVTLTATASSGYVFSGWSGNLTGTTNPATIVMDSNKTVTANFTQQQQQTYTLTVNISPTGAGTVTLNPPGGTYSAGQVVVLTAQANSGYQFLNWRIGQNTVTSNPTTVTMNSNITVTANFEQIGQDTARYNFEASAQGWVHQTYTDSQAITAVARDTTRARYGSASLRCTVNLIGGHANYSKGEAYVDMQTPVNLSNTIVTVWVWVPQEAVGDETSPNGIQIFFKDSNWRNRYSSWRNIGGGEIIPGQWSKVEVNTATEIWGWDEPGFNLNQVRVVGVKIGAGGQSTATFNGYIWIDSFNW